VIVYPYFRSPLRHLPRPKVYSYVSVKHNEPMLKILKRTQGEWPFVGQGIAPHRKPVCRLYLKWMTEVPNDGLITYRSIFNGDRLLITSPQAIAEVLVHNSYCYEKPAEERAIIGRFLGDGLTIVEGDVHRAQRKLMAPVYALKNIKALYPIFWSKAHQLVDKVAMRIKKGNVPHGATAKNCGPSTVQEITFWVNKTTLDIIGLAGLGKDFGNLEDTKNDLFEVYQEVFQYALAKDIFMAVNRTLPTKFVQLLPWGINDRINATTVLLRQVCQTLVDEKLSNFEENEGKVGRSRDIMSLLIRASGWVPRQLVEQLLTFVAAGYVQHPSLISHISNMHV
jgi:cytochrome P450